MVHGKDLVVLFGVLDRDVRADGGRDLVGGVRDEVRRVGGVHPVIAMLRIGNGVPGQDAVGQGQVFRADAFFLLPVMVKNVTLSAFRT